MLLSFFFPLKLLSQSQTQQEGEIFPAGVRLPLWIFLDISPLAPGSFSCLGFFLLLTSLFCLGGNHDSGIKTLQAPVFDSGY